MRNDRRIGSPVADSTGDRDLDDVVAAAAVRAAMSRSVVFADGIEPAGAADAAFAEQLAVRAARLVLAEAVLEGVAEVVDAEVPGAAGVGAVQEGAVVAGVRHIRLRTA